MDIPFQKRIEKYFNLNERIPQIITNKSEN